MQQKKKEGAPTLCNILGGSGEYYAKWNKPGGERQIPYDLIYKWDLINKTSKQNITSDIEINNKLTVTREERGGGNRGEGEGSSRNMYKGHMDKVKEG